MAEALKETDFSFPVYFEKYKGKVRDIYNIGDEVMVMVASDRISAFDHVLPRAIPYKGQVLNQTAAYFLKATEDIMPNHLISTPDPNVSLCHYLKPLPVEIVVRGYLAGHAWRVYKSGGRELCGVNLPEGLKESDRLPEPILTPTTKSMIGHDEDISEAEILKSGLVDQDVWLTAKHYAFELFKRGSELAAEKGLILVDTKYEFGLDRDGKLFLIDEIHTPDSSRYYYSEGYAERQEKGEAQRQLSKEFVREWLMEHGFQGKDGQEMPEMPDDFVNLVSERYIELYEKVTGQTFKREDTSEMHNRILNNIIQGLNELKQE